MQDNIFKSEYNSVSELHAVFEDDGITGWAYLYDGSSEQIVADGWIYNSKSANDTPEAKEKDSPPPLPKELLVDDPITFDEINDVSFRWFDDGRSVYVIVNGFVIAYIDLRSSRSYNVNLKRPCPWGEPLEL